MTTATAFSMKIAQRCQKVFETLWVQGKCSIRDAAKRTGMSKSSVHRHKQTIERRQLYPESSLWESREGYLWLVRFVWATIYWFGIKQGIGSENLSEYFKLLHLEQRIGVSPDSLRKLELKLKGTIITYEHQQTSEGQPVKPIEICVGSDEVFFGDPILVMLELSSGFIFIETAAANRQYSTWQQQAEAALPSERFHCRWMVSDGAKALIKLALDGLGCRWVPDLFHSMWNLGKPIGATLGRRLAQLNKQIQTLDVQLHQARQQGKPTEQLESQQQELATEHSKIQKAQQTYHQALQQISTQVHPFAIDSNRLQTALAVQAALEESLKPLEPLTQTWAIAKAAKAIQAFRAQIPAIAMGVNAWWRWVVQALETESVPVELGEWLLEAMLPWVYWNQQANRTKQPQLRQTYLQAAEQAQLALMTHPLTQTLSVEEQQQWWSWSIWMVSKFQRTSSAVEGRNGCLSQLHHTNRGLDRSTLQVLKIIHNYGLKRPDGTTAAQRLFGQPFPDLFEWVLEQMDELPQPRKSKKSTQPQMPTLQAVPA